MGTDHALAPIAKATRMLAEATTLEEILHVANLAQRAADFAKAAGMGLEASNQAKRIELAAHRKAGETIKAAQERGELDAGRGGDRKSPSQSGSVKLADIGLTYNQSSRFQAAASVPEKEFQEWVGAQVEAKHELTSSALRKIAKQRKAQKPQKQVKPVEGITEDLTELIEADQKFACIYADPPWQYGNQATRAATDNHYSTMTVAEICAERVEEVAADNAHLHLWTTNAFLFEAQRVIEAWGFEYKSCLVWVKPQLGIGNYWRVSHEFLLFGIRGKCPFLDKSLRSWVEANRTEHSEKPDAVRAMVEKASPEPRLEMYGRRSVEGWTVYGNQVQRMLVT